MPFRFSLQAVLRLRQSYERLEELRLTMIIAYINQLHRQLETILQERTIASEQLAARLKEGMVTSEYRFELAALATLAERRNMLVDQIAKAEQQRAAQEQAYRQAQKKRKILENLRSRQLAAYRQIQVRRDQQQLDDLFALRLPHGRDVD